jgi:regulator of protease activity HflC (stomatin/prohibitin superfamily)
MSFLKWIRVLHGQRVVVYRDGFPIELLRPGRHLRVAIGGGLAIERFSTRETWVDSIFLEEIARSGVLAGDAVVLDLAAGERAIVKIDGRYAGVRGEGVWAVWTADREVEVERFAIGFGAPGAGPEEKSLRLEHPALPAIVQLPGAKEQLEVAVVPAGSTGLVLVDGKPHAAGAEIGPGLAAFWKGAGKVQVVLVDRREQTLDVAGQEILTADQVTVRLNALVVHRVVDAVRAVTGVDHYGQALYRQAQLVLRAVVGARELATFLAGKEEVVSELRESLAARAAELGVEVLAFGIRDVILPGEMKEILNRVVEARKLAEAALVTRREETAAIRMQANTARIFESNPTLLKLRELEVLERVADKANLTVVLGEGGLSERVVKML